MLCEPTPTARKEIAARIVGETGGKLVHPYDDYTVMAGQGTVGLELAEQVEIKIKISSHCTGQMTDVDHTPDCRCPAWTWWWCLSRAGG